MSDTEKLNKIAVLVEQWRVSRDKFEKLSETFSSDLTTIQYVVYDGHIRALEKILYG